MANSVILDNQKSKRLINRCIKESRRIQSIYQDTECIKVINNFINTFKKCEIICKILLKEYLIKTRQYDSDCNIELKVSQIKAALNMINLKIEEEIIQKIFSSNSQANNRSARIIRNSITHNMSQACIDELLRRKNDLLNVMSEFINSFIIEK